MTIEAYISNLKSQPAHIRQQIAFWSSFGVTVVIFLFWLASVTGVTGSATSTVAQAVDRAGSPAQSITASVGSLFGDIKDIFFAPKKITYSSIEVRPGK